MQRNKVIAGNWKMHKTATESVEFVKGLQSKQLENGYVRIILCAPFTSLFHMNEQIGTSPVGLGAQNMHYEESGAYTGEIAPGMLEEAGVDYVILGHSERRQYYNETSEGVGKKTEVALTHGIKPIICIGETLDQREAGQVEDVLDQQLTGAFASVKEDQLDNLMIAYEPVWAIGTGVTATPEQAVEAHQIIRRWLDSRYSDGVGEQVPILYGGSMKPANAEELLVNEDIDGWLIGGASLQVTSFYELIEIARGLS